VYVTGSTSLLKSEMPEKQNVIEIMP